VHALRAPTNLAWLIGRTQTHGRADYAAVQALQRRYLLQPLSAWRSGAAASTPRPAPSDVNLETATVDQVARLDAARFFRRLCALMVANPPATADAPVLRRFAQLGLAPGGGFELGALPPGAQHALERYALGDRDPLHRNPDGSLDLLLQHEPPPEPMRGNWLPAPRATFNLILRMYWPKPAVLEGRWQPPPVHRVH
jgi:hypothetical protein